MDAAKHVAQKSMKAYGPQALMEMVTVHYRDQWRELVARRDLWWWADAEMIDDNALEHENHSC